MIPVFMKTSKDGRFLFDGEANFVEVENLCLLLLLFLWNVGVCVGVSKGVCVLLNTL